MNVLLAGLQSENEWQCAYMAANDMYKMKSPDPISYVFEGPKKEILTLYAWYNKKDDEICVTPNPVQFCENGKPIKEK